MASLTAVGERSLGALESAMRALFLEVTNDVTPQTLEILIDALTRLSHRLRSCCAVLQASNRRHLRGREVRKSRQRS